MILAQIPENGDKETYPSGVLGVIDLSEQYNLPILNRVAEFERHDLIVWQVGIKSNGSLEQEVEVYWMYDQGWMPV